MTKFDQFISDDAGAVTIDWVALTAGILLLGVGIVTLLFDEVSNLTGTIQSQLDSANSLSGTLPN